MLCHCCTALEDWIDDVDECVWLLPAPHRNCIATIQHVFANVANCWFVPYNEPPSKFFGRLLWIHRISLHCCKSTALASRNLRYVPVYRQLSNHLRHQRFFADEYSHLEIATSWMSRRSLSMEIFIDFIYRGCQVSVWWAQRTVARQSYSWLDCYSFEWNVQSNAQFIYTPAIDTFNKSIKFETDKREHWRRLSETEIPSDSSDSKDKIGFGERKRCLRYVGRSETQNKNR